jgi:hypothetical protein
VKNDKLFVWNLATASLVYRIDRIASGVPPALSPGRRYLVVPHGHGATMVDVASGKLLGYCQSGVRATPQVLFHPDGKRVALCAANQIAVCDLESGEQAVDSVLAEAVGGPPWGWVGRHLLLLNSGDLVRTDLATVLWNYSLPGRAKVCCVPDGILVATSRQTCSVVSLRVPHPYSKRAESLVENRGGELMQVSPGSLVALGLECPQEIERGPILAALNAAVERTGWKVVPQSDTKVLAIIRRGEPKRLEFRHPRPSGTWIETVSISPFTARLEVRLGETVLWHRESASRIPSLIVLKDGETLQQAASQYERADVEFFSRIRIPPSVPRPEAANGLGRSTVEGTGWKDTPAAVRSAARATTGA